MENCVDIEKFEDTRRSKSKKDRQYNGYNTMVTIQWSQYPLRDLSSVITLIAFVTEEQSKVHTRVDLM
jgi:hypothetical protein